MQILACLQGGHGRQAAGQREPALPAGQLQAAHAAQGAHCRGRNVEAGHAVSREDQLGQAARLSARDDTCRGTGVSNIGAG